MRIGVCGGIDRIRLTAECGFDYFETGFGMLAKDSDEEIEAFQQELLTYNIPCEACNGFIPGDLKTVGPDVDFAALEAYLKKGFDRAGKIGVKTVVFGSGGSRRIPDGYPYDMAVRDIIRFMTDLAAPMAAEKGITLVFEPLCKLETNLINTVKEGAMLASAINLPNVASLADLYHMHMENDTYDDIKELKGIIRHAHISNPVSITPELKRMYMKSPDEYDYAGFFEALQEAGCERVSIEANTNDFDTDVRDSYGIMKQYK